jgi:hypothetical protein
MALEHRRPEGLTCPPSARNIGIRLRRSSKRLPRIGVGGCPQVPGSPGSQVGHQDGRFLSEIAFLRLLSPTEVAGRRLDSGPVAVVVL